MDNKTNPFLMDDDPGHDHRFIEHNGELKYVGEEHRHHIRRVCADRRQMIRFEPGKEDRRSGLDRRKGSWNIRYTV